MIRLNLNIDPRLIKGIMLPIFSNSSMKTNLTLDSTMFPQEVGHWALLLINFRGREIIFMDSLGEQNSFMSHSLIKNLGERLYQEIFLDETSVLSFKFLPTQRNQLFSLFKIAFCLGQRNAECGVSMLINFQLVLTGYLSDIISYMNFIMLNMMII